MNSPGLQHYEHVYGVVLLDDLHNYFPALLYEQNRFHSVSSVFHYVRAQMNRRFNLYQYGASLYAPPSTLPQQQEQRLPRVIIPPSPLTQTRMPEPPTPTPAPTVIREVDPLSSVLSAQMLLNLFDLATRGVESEDPPAIPQMPAANPPIVRRLLQPRRPTNLGRWDGVGFSPVLVRPTPEVLARATLELNGTQVPENTICTICQDTISPVASTIARKLLPCGHFYHRGCIDEWFTRSVLCPTCRHDIRE